MAKYAQLVATGLPPGVLVTVKDAAGKQVSDHYPGADSTAPDNRAIYADGDGNLAPNVFLPNGTYTVAYSGGSKTVTVSGAVGVPAASVYVDQATQAELDAAQTTNRGTYPSVFHVTAYGALGDGTTDDTAAIQAAITAAQAVQGIVYFRRPSSFYKITAPLDVTVKNGISLRGEAARVRVKQVTANTHAIRLLHDAGSEFTYNQDVLIENLRIQGPGAGTTGIGLWTDPAAAAYAANNLMIRNVGVEDFDIGVQLYKYDNCTVDTLLIKRCRIGWSSAGNANDIHLTNAGSSGCTQTGYQFGDGGGVTFRPGDNISTPQAVHLLANARVTMHGGDFESNNGSGTEFIRVDANAALTHFGGQFTLVGGNDVPRYSVAGRCAAFMPTEGGFTTATMAKDATTASCYLFRGDALSAWDKGIQDSASSAIYRGGLLEQRLDNSVPAASSFMRGALTYILSRDASAKEDRLVFYVRNKDNSTFEAVDLIQERVSFSTAGNNDFTRQEGLRRYAGRKSFTTAAAASTDVTINLGTGSAAVAYTTLIHALATVSIEGGTPTGPVSVVYRTSTSTTVTFRVFHPNDVAGALSWRLGFDIAVI